MRLEEPKPTMRRLVQIACMGDIDRICLVQKERPGKREAGIFILLFGNPAVREIGPRLREAAITTGKLKSDQQLNFDLDSDLGMVFQWMQDTGERWLSGTLTIDGQGPVIQAAFYGTAICAPLAPFLAEHNCPCSLT